MSRLSVANKRVAPMALIAETLQNTIKSRGQEFASADHTRAILSLENLNEPSLQSLAHHTDEIRRELQSVFAGAFGDSVVSAENFSEAQWESGILAAMAAGDPAAYHKAANTMQQTVSTENLKVVEPMTFGVHGVANYSDKSVSLEAFDDRELRNHMAYSIAFNVNAARQDEFGEAFYPTVVVSPDQAGLDVSVRRPMLMNEVRHSVTGRAMDFQRRNLIDALVEPTLLANESTRVVPVVIDNTVPTADGTANNANFLMAAEYDRVLEDGVTVATAPLLPGVEVDLLGLGQREDLATQGVYDVTDALDTRLYLESVYLDVTGATAGGVATPLTSTIKFDVSRLPRNAFVKTVEGTDRESYLAFTTVDLPLSALTTDIDDAVADAVAVLVATYPTVVVKLGVQLNGSANHELGNIRVTGASVTVDSAINSTTGAPVDAATLAAVKAEFSATFAGYEVVAARTNTNRRTRGLQVTSLELTERYTIPLLAPINALAPVSSNRDASDLTTLISATRIRNSNLAVTQLLNYNDTLQSYALSQNRLTPVPAIEGVGRHLVRPYHDAISLDAQAVTASIKSQDRAADVSSAIINTIRDAVYRMYRESGYQGAADMLSGTVGEKPVVIIGTDPVTAKHINITGDTRTLGFHFESRVVTSMDRRVYGKIFVTFVRPNQQGVDPLSFGVMAWMPELAGTIQLTRNGATIKETMVQPRVRHINLLPCLIAIDVTNLSEAIADQLPINMATV